MARSARRDGSSVVVAASPSARPGSPTARASSWRLAARPTCSSHPSPRPEPRIKGDSVATKIIFAPKMPDPIMDIARAMVTAGYEKVVSEHDDPNFLTIVERDEYYSDLPRAGMSDAFFRAGTKLKLVQLISAGYDRIDVPAAKTAGVPIANNGGANSVAVAEHTIMLILAVYKKMAFHHINVTHGKWRVGGFAAKRAYRLGGESLGIVGRGTRRQTGARRAEALHIDIQYCDVIRLTEDQEDALGVKFALFPELLASSDVVSLHVPLNDQTRKMMGAREFGMMKTDAIFINTCRGPVVDEEALRHALLSKQIAAAGLDVMAEEPPLINHPLFGLENVTFTPHSAGPTWENWTKAFRNAFDNVQRVARGDKPLWVIPELR